MSIKGFDKIARKYISLAVAGWMLFICTVFTVMTVAKVLTPILVIAVPIVITIFWLAVIGVAIYRRARRW